ncbi:hypothetical protein [Paenibacillus sp. OAE614]|uniref:hypothetical protein n=1 Tax=Paenibacillus sp. OAE614 TaxID=2663804 RepID=UPI00178C13B8
MKNVYRRTFKEDRPRLAEVFLAIIEWFSFAEIYKFYNLKQQKTVQHPNGFFRNGPPAEPFRAYEKEGLTLAHSLLLPHFRAEQTREHTWPWTVPTGIQLYRAFHRFFRCTQQPAPSSVQIRVFVFHQFLLYIVVFHHIFLLRSILRIDGEVL